MKQTVMFEGIETPKGGVLSSHRNRVIYLLRAYSAAGRTLAEISGPRIMGRSIRTLRQYCADGKIKFADWTPRCMRPPKPPKKKRGDIA